MQNLAGWVLDHHYQIMQMSAGQGELSLKDFEEDDVFNKTLCESLKR